MNLLVSIIVNTLSVLAAAYIVPGVNIPNFTTAILVAVVLGVLNALVKPVITLLTLPLSILTFGLFIFVINACKCFSSFICRWRILVSSSF